MSRARQTSMGLADGQAEPYVTEFRAWIGSALDRNDRESLAKWQQLAPHASRAHPTPEHLMPLFVAFGAAAEKPVRVEPVDAGIDHGVLAMDAYVFWPQA